MSKIKFTRISLTKTQYQTTFLNKTKKKSINANNSKENYTLSVQDTPISGITAEQDFNYFLAKGCRKEIVIDNCELGFPFTKNNLVNSKFIYNGAISYTVEPGLIIRSNLTLYGEFALVPLISSTTYYLPIPTGTFSGVSSFFSVLPNSSTPFSATIYSF